MMKRPEKWYELPGDICDYLAWKTDLNYDPYESSKAEAVDNLRNNPTYFVDNCKLVQETYDKISDETLNGLLKNQITSLQREIKAIEKLLIGD